MINYTRTVAELHLVEDIPEELAQKLLEAMTKAANEVLDQEDLRIEMPSSSKRFGPKTPRSSVTEY